MCSLSRGIITRVVETGETPISMLITPSWGFVLICSQSWKQGKYIGRISIYTINGLFIRSVEIVDQVSYWISYAKEGFDYVVMTDTKGKLFHFEAFYLRVGRPLFRFGKELISLTFSGKDGILYSITEEGKVIFVNLYI